MRRVTVCTVAALLIFAGGLAAGECKGKLKVIDSGKNTVTITTADGKDHVFSFYKDTQFLSAKGKQFKEGFRDKHFKEGSNVILKYEMKDGKETCTTFQLAQAKKPNK